MGGKRSNRLTLALCACAVIAMAALCLLLYRHGNQTIAQATTGKLMAARVAACTLALVTGLLLVAGGLVRSLPQQGLQGLICLSVTGFACSPIFQAVGGVEPVLCDRWAEFFFCLTLLLVLLLHCKLLGVSGPLFYSAMVYGAAACVAALLPRSQAGTILRATLLRPYPVVFIVCLLAAAIRAARAKKNTLYPRLTLAGIAAFGASLAMELLLSGPGGFFELGGGVLVACLGIGACRGAVVEYRALKAAALLGEERKSRCDMLLAAQHRRVEAMEREMDEARRARHDLRHHLTLLRQLVQSDLYKALEYIDTLITALPSGEEPVCKNLAADSLLRQYVAAARQMGARTETAVDLPEHLGVSDLDLCVALGNLLENALEALRREDTNDRLLRITAGATEKVLAVNIDNTLPHQHQGGPGAPRPPNRARPGIGLASVRAVAEKYGGEFRWRAEDGLFRASIVLKTENG